MGCPGKVWGLVGDVLDCLGASWERIGCMYKGVLRASWGVLGNSGASGGRLGDDLDDNMWGYVTDLITRYQVRWIEMAAVLPLWTCMIVYYVEGDKGNLMNEVMKAAQNRTAVRGHT